MTRARYLQLWQQLFDCERETEEWRRRLLRNPRFEVKRAFDEVDTEGKGYINQRDIEEVIKREGHQINDI